MSDADLLRLWTVYLDENLQHWLIPYGMKREVGQTPRHLAQAPPRADGTTNQGAWVWLGGSGWYGTLTPEEIAEAKTLRAEAGLQWWGEFTELPATPERFPALAAKLATRARR